MVDVEWEKFLGGPVKPPALRMHATIARGGRIHLNANLYKRLGSPDAVWLFFNRRLQQIAVQATSLRMPEAFPVGALSNHTTRYISAASFCIFPTASETILSIRDKSASSKNAVVEPNRPP